MKDVFLSPYNSLEHEKKIYKLWEESKFFNPDEMVKENILDEKAESFTILMPPPNITGVLHLGHALEHSLMDVRIRAERLRGKKALLIPGTDHAAIATQARVEKDLLKNDGVKNALKEYGREKLLKIIKEYADEAQKNILLQIRALGTSCDWSRLAYTFDEDRSKTVRYIFKRMYDDGLIYRGTRIVNWDSRLKTTISDDEIIREQEKSKFYYFKYGPFTIGTARPETKFGDKYVVLNPKDSRYKEYKHGQKLEVEWINGKIEATILKDEAVDMEFGTGAMTITPWHDLVDFELAEKYNLEKEQIIDWNGKLLPIAEEFAGMHISKARPLIIEKLKNKNLLVDIDDDYIHSPARSERSNEIIEPQIKEQWFINVKKKIPHLNKSLNDLQVEALDGGIGGDKNKEIKIFPDNFKKVYYQWVNNPRDWCISRQIIWGHQIPVWYKGDKVYCDINPPKEDGWIQDEDTLDTWFSSGTWAFSTLGVKDKESENTRDKKTYYPTNWIQMGYEILFLWMARMILMSVYLLDEIPFKEVYIHGLVRDKTGKKFSKSLRNTIDPLETIEKYGSDALRFAMLTGITSGQDVKFDESKVKHAKHFMNKIWNVSRFILQNTEKVDLNKKCSFTDEDKQIDNELKELEDTVYKHINVSQYNLAVSEVYEYVWHRFADEIIEESKKIFNGNDSQKIESRAIILYNSLLKILKITHPFAPFITETIYQNLPYKKASLLMIDYE